MSARRVFAVDLGASGGKCFVGTFEPDRFALDEIHRFSHEAVSFHLPDAAGRRVERMHWDDTLLFRHIVEGLHEYRRRVGPELDSLGIDTWGADGALVDANGESLGKMYAYRDHRLDDMVAKVQQNLGAFRTYELTGIHFWPFNLSNQLHWLVTERKELLRPGCRFLPAPSLFYYYLGAPPVVDSTFASVSQLMDARRKDWSREILDKLGIPEGLLPGIVAPGTVVGELSLGLAGKVGLNAAKLIAVASHDTASAFAAAPAEKPEEALIISSGTWSLVGMLVPEPITSAEAMKANLSNEGGIGNIRLLRNCMGTWIVQELRRVWRETDGRELGWAELERMAAAAPAFAAFIDPDDLWFYNPPNMEKAIAEFCRKTGQTAPTDRGTLARVVYESLALKYRVVNEVLGRISGLKSRLVHVVGGGCRNPTLNQFTADSLGLPVFAGPEEATAIGNAMVQAVGLGVLRDMNEAQSLIRRSFAVKQYTPENPQRWDEAYRRFRERVG